MTRRALFIDCNEQMAPVLDDVRRANDVALDVNMRPCAADDLPALLGGYDIAVDDHSYVPTDVAARCTGLRDIVFLGTGPSSYMDLDALRGLGITVHAIKGYGDTAVAEHSVALMFACARDVARMDREVRRGEWQTREGMQLLGKRLGIVGLGGIGAEVARIAAGIGMEVAYWNRTPRAAAHGTPAALDDLLATSDVVSLHLGLNDETRNILDRRRLSLMKPGAMLVNTARGALVDEAALLEALDSGQIGSAGLDVFAREPLAPDHPLARHEKVTLTAHAGFRTYEASANLLARGLEIVRRLIEAEP